jgi:hypothetical protein
LRLAQRPGAGIAREKSLVVAISMNAPLPEAQLNVYLDRKDRNMNRGLGLIWFAAVVSLGCSYEITWGEDNVGVGGDIADAGGGAPNLGPSDLPCDVQNVLATHCQACHTKFPPGALVTRADLLSASLTDDTLTMAEESLVRLQATDSTHMPPAPHERVTSAEIQSLRAWVEVGMPEDSCGMEADAGPDPYDTPVVCTSDKRWTGGNEESPNMRPGGACIHCHSEEREGPIFAAAGTVYPTPHEPNDCNGVSGKAEGAVVEVTDANGEVHTLEPNRAGNFMLEARGFAYPYTAKVVYQGRERVMVESQKNGDCNKCHTEAGSHDAPGRIFLP